MEPVWSHFNVIRANACCGLQVDILTWRKKTDRIHAQIKDICAILSGLLVAQDYKKGQALIKDKDFKHNAEFFQVGRGGCGHNTECFQVARGPLYALEGGVFNGLGLHQGQAQPRTRASMDNMQTFQEQGKVDTLPCCRAACCYLCHRRQCLRSAVATRS